MSCANLFISQRLELFRRATSRRTATGCGAGRKRLWPLSRAGVRRSEVARYARRFLSMIPIIRSTKPASRIR